MIKPGEGEAYPVSGTAFYDRTAALNGPGRWYQWDRSIIVDVYSDLHGEMKALRSAAALFDMSAMTITMVKGRDAGRLVNRIVTRELSGLEVDQVRYAAWCDEAGHVVFEGPVFRLGQETYCFTGQPQDEWLRWHAEGCDVDISITSTANLALQGPRSQEVLEQVTGLDWSDLKLFRRRVVGFADGELAVTRMGFTGEYGYELWTTGDIAPVLWDALMEGGARPAGHFAHDVARVEAGYILIGAEYTGAGPERLSVHCPPRQEDLSSPFELGLSHVVDFNKSDFVGRDVLVAQHEAGAPARALVGLELDWADMVALYARYGLPPEPSGRVQRCRLPLLTGEASVGRATSLTWSPTVNKMIGFGHVHRQYQELGTRLFVEWTVDGQPERVGAVVSPLPFVAPCRPSSTTRA